jgi:hypothetical protein
VTKTRAKIVLLLVLVLGVGIVADWSKVLNPSERDSKYNGAGHIKQTWGKGQPSPSRSLKDPFVQVSITLPYSIPEALVQVTGVITKEPQFRIDDDFSRHYPTKRGVTVSVLVSRIQAGNVTVAIWQVDQPPEKVEVCRTGGERVPVFCSLRII